MELNIIAHPDTYMINRKKFGKIENKVANMICRATEKFNMPLEINLAQIFNETYYENIKLIGGKMKIGIDIDGVILDYERVLKTYGDLYDFIELKKNGIVNRNEHYLRNRYDWTEEERMNFINKYFLKLSKLTNLIPGAKDVINMLQNEGHELIVISARGGMIEEMKDVAIEKFIKEKISFNTYYWKQDDKLEVAQKEQIDFMIDDSYDVCKKLSENGIRTIYFRDKEMKKLEQNKYLKEVSNWGEIYRYIKEMEIR